MLVMAMAHLGGCDQEAPVAPVPTPTAAKPVAAPTTPAKTAVGPSKRPKTRRRSHSKKAIPVPLFSWPDKNVVGQPPPASPSLQEALARLRQHASVRETRGLQPRLSRRTLATIILSGGHPALPPVAPSTLSRRIRGEVVAVHYDGGRAAVVLRHNRRNRAAFFYLEDGAWLLDLTGPTTWTAPSPGEASPLNRAVSMAEATADVPGSGPLLAHFDTSAGTIRCQLHEKRTPRTVAHFVALARGMRGHRVGGEPNQPPRWVRRPFYDGLRFHRVALDRFIQTGDLSGTGTGQAGFTIADELDLNLRHDRAGVLSLASAGPNTGSSQVLITAAPAPNYDDVHVVFGLCRDLNVITRIASTPAHSHVIRSVRFNRSR